jgi:hypothetical protein
VLDGRGCIYFDVWKTVDKHFVLVLYVMSAIMRLYGSPKYSRHDRFITVQVRASIDPAPHEGHWSSVHLHVMTAK